MADVVPWRCPEKAVDTLISLYIMIELVEMTEFPAALEEERVEEVLISENCCIVSLGQKHIVAHTVHESDINCLIILCVVLNHTPVCPLKWSTSS